METKINVSYISCWDGCEDVESSAYVVKESGEVVITEMQEVGREYVMCIGEFVKYKDGTVEQVIEDNGCYTVVSKCANKESHEIAIHGVKFIVSTELDKGDMHNIYNIPY